MAFGINLNNVTNNILRGHSIKGSVLSGLSGSLRSIAIASFGAMSVSVIHLTNLDTSETLSFAWTPEKIDVSQNGRFQSYNILDVGPVKIPHGENLNEIKWNARLPGEIRLGHHFINKMYWQSPKSIIKMLESWRKDGNKLRILVTNTSINQDVYLDSFSYTFEGGHGDAMYDISLVQAKDVVVYTVEEKKELDKKKQANALTERASRAKKSAEQINGDSSLWTVAQKYLGDGGQWLELYTLNQTKFTAASDTVKAGSILKLPI